MTAPGDTREREAVVAERVSEAAVTTGVREEVVRRLDMVEREEDVRVLYACESGSRAWGFASPDSDYDVRFVYAHRPDWYLSIADRRDVIERPIVDELDLSGWELRKALRLFRKSNPPLLEWLGSPIVYRERTTLASRLRALAARGHSPRSCAYHYLNMARRNHAAYLQGGRHRVRLKKYLYVLRPLLAVRWIESGRGVVPMEFERLVEAMVTDTALRQAIDTLLARKRTSPELGQGPRIAAISEFIEAEIAGHGSNLGAGVEPPPSLETLDLLFRTVLEEAWGSATPRAHMALDGSRA